MAFAAAAQAGGEDMHLEGLQGAVGLRHGGSADEAVGLDVLRLRQRHGADRGLVGEPDRQLLAVAGLQLQVVVGGLLDGAAQRLQHARRRLRGEAGGTGQEQAEEQRGGSLESKHRSILGGVEPRWSPRRRYPEMTFA